MAKKKHKEPLTYYARIYKRSLTTIGIWAKQGAPFDDAPAMAQFIKEKEANYKGPQPVEDRGKVKAIPGTVPASAVPTLAAPAPPEYKVKGLTQYQLKTEEISLKVERQRFLFETEKGNYVERDKVREAGIVLVTELQAELKRISTELPSTGAGLDEAALLEKVTSYHNILLNNLRSKLLALNFGPNEPASPLPTAELSPA